MLVGLTARTDTVDQVGVEALAPGRTSPASPSLPCLEHRGGCRGEERFMILILVIIDTTTMPAGGGGGLLVDGQGPKYSHYQGQGYWGRRVWME